MQIFWLDRERLRSNIRDAVGALAADHAEVQKAVLFGSVAEGRALPSSDVDLLLIVSESGEPFVERPARYSRRLQGIGLSVDLFVYTRAEAGRGDIPLLRTALERGEVLFEREP